MFEYLHNFLKIIAYSYVKFKSAAFLIINFIADLGRAGVI